MITVAAEVNSAAATTATSVVRPMDIPTLRRRTTRSTADHPVIDSSTNTPAAYTAR